MAFGGGVRLRGPRAVERAQQAARSAGRVPLASLLASDAVRDENFGLPVAGSTPDGGPPKWGSDIIRDGETPVAADRGGARPGPGAGFAGARERNPWYRTEDEMARTGSGSSSGGSSSGGPWDQWLDPESAAWVRGLFGPTDTSEQEAFARQQHEAALGRSQADLEARGGMAGMGLVGGQIAMGADLQRQAADALTEQILGIQDTAAQRDLQRGTIAAEFLDRAVGRGLQAQEIEKDDAMTLAVLAQMGLRPVYDENGNITSFESIDPEVADAQAEIDDQNRQQEQRYQNVPEVEYDAFGGVWMPGSEIVDEYTDSDGVRWVVLRDREGKLWRMRD